MERVVESNRTAFFHFANLVSVGIRRKTDGTYQVAYSVCCGRDKFNRKLGRSIVSGRLDKFDKINDRYQDILDEWTAQKDSIIDFAQESPPCSVFHAQDDEEVIMILESELDKILFYQRNLGKDFLRKINEEISKEVSTILPRIKWDK